MFQTNSSSLFDVWILWGVASSLLAVITYRGLKQINWTSLGQFNRDQRGASYALPYVLTFPWILLLTCIMIQGTLILMVKFGTIYASYAATRSAIVWQSSDPSAADKSMENANYHALRAAMLAMTPFASGYPRHLEQIFPGVVDRALRTNTIPRAGLETIALNELFRLYSGVYQRAGRAHAGSSGQSSPVIRRPNALARDDYVRNKLVFAGLSTQVEFVNGNTTQWNDDVSVKVTYLMPMHIPGAGRILANRSSGPWYAPKFFAREVSTTVSLPSEAPQTKTHRLNVPYFPSFMTRYFGL